MVDFLQTTLQVLHFEFECGVIVSRLADRLRAHQQPTDRRGLILKEIFEFSSDNGNRFQATTVDLIVFLLNEWKGVVVVVGR